MLNCSPVVMYVYVCMERRNIHHSQEKVIRYGPPFLFSCSFFLSFLDRVPVFNHTSGSENGRIVRELRPPD
jgi:hypothetical protein